jgi:hypothetical protein
VSDLSRRPRLLEFRTKRMTERPKKNVSDLRKRQRRLKRRPNLLKKPELLLRPRQRDLLKKLNKQLRLKQLELRQRKLPRKRLPKLSRRLPRKKPKPTLNLRRTKMLRVK